MPEVNNELEESGDALPINSIDGVALAKKIDDIEARVKCLKFPMWKREKIIGLIKEIKEESNAIKNIEKFEELLDCFEN